MRELKDKLAYLAFAIAYLSLPFILIFAGYNMMSVDDKTYLHSLTHSLSYLGERMTSMLVIAFSLYATPVFLVPWILAETLKKLKGVESGNLLFIVEIVATAPFLLLSIGFMLLYSRLNPGAVPAEKSRLTMAFCNVIGMVFVAAFSMRMVEGAVVLIGALSILSLVLAFLGPTKRPS
ncbi:MAG: hypothetical protein PHF60_05185 [Candidatus ainarchaeum sp.]|nr:hypothetical protein [Candidatus ainarchaeum sp.]